jgi:hypothetical protein
MAIDTIPPWVRGPNVEAALSSGGAVGESGARLQAGREESAARLAQDAMQHDQQLQMESARLSQSEHLAQMEAQARKEVNEQNQLREQQRLAITSAYHQAQLGMEKGRLEQQQAVAQAKAKEAAAAFQREQAFAADVASGTSVMDAYRRNPVSASVLNAIGRTQLKESEGKPVLREGKYPLIEYDPKTHSTREVYTPPKSVGLSKVDTEDLKDLRHERDELTKRMGDAGMEKIAPTPPAQRKAQEAKLNEINQRIEEIKRPKLKSPTTSTGDSKDKVVRAHALAIAHPDWTKEQVIDAVNKEMP